MNYINAKSVSQEDINKYIEEHQNSETATNENESSEEHDHDHDHDDSESKSNDFITGETTEYGFNSQSLLEVINTISNVYYFKVTGENCSFEFSFTAENEEIGRAHV